MLSGMSYSGLSGRRENLILRAFILPAAAVAVAVRFKRANSEGNVSTTAKEFIFRKHIEKVVCTHEQCAGLYRTTNPEVTVTIYLHRHKETKLPGFPTRCDREEL